MVLDPAKAVKLIPGKISPFRYTATDLAIPARVSLSFPLSHIRDPSEGLP